MYGSGSSLALPPPTISTLVDSPTFELSGQTNTYVNPQSMASSGMNCLKFQLKWNPGDKPGDLAERTNNAHAFDFKVLLSFPGAKVYPDSISFSKYVNFLGGVAALGPDAIEAWNEINIDFEWPAGQIIPSSYVSDMLATAKLDHWSSR